MISTSVSGSFKKTESFLRNALKVDILSVLKASGKLGVEALSSITPKDTGRAASSWAFETSVKNKVYIVTWTNSDVENGFPVVIRLQYGYGTGTGGYVQGQDFINPAIQPIFEKIANDVWKAVTKA